MKQQTSPRSRLILLGIGLALAGSIYAIFHEGCQVCSQSAELVGGLNLGAIGIVFYTLLLTASLGWTLSRSARASSILRRAVTAGMLLAGGVHLTLLAMLLRNKIFCPPCMITAAGALIGAGALLTFDLERRHLARSVIALLAVSVATFGATKILRRYAATAYERAAVRAEQALLREEPHSPRGYVRMVVYERPTCHYCQAFKAQVLPPLRHEFNHSLVVEERPAWKEMITPTVILLGKKNVRLLGFNPLAKVREAVRVASDNVEIPG